MSSIYRKGRDGYYYYQTYVYNIASGKKNKRIFHSLKTKDVYEAKEKQKFYDKKYEELSKNKLKNKLSINSNFKISLIVMATSVITFCLTRIIDYQINDKKKSKDDIVQSKLELTQILTNDTLKKINDEVDEVLNNNDKTSESSKLFDEENSGALALKEIKKVEKNIIPDYTIQFVEQISGVFEQGKIYVTVDNFNKKNDLKSLSILIKNDYPLFSNIIICFYTNTEVGRNLAKGIKQGINDEEQQRAWLAMYSYNPVEGEYFDDNPGGYLGAY